MVCPNCDSNQVWTIRCKLQCAVCHHIVENCNGD